MKTSNVNGDTAMILRIFLLFKSMVRSTVRSRITQLQSTFDSQNGEELTRK